MTEPDARDELREALARHLADEDAATRGALPYADTSWACVRGRWLPKADRFLPVVTAWAEKQARARAAEELRKAAEDWDDLSVTGEYAADEASSFLRRRADALPAGDPA